MPLSTPVVLIIFNRPDLTEIVFEAIAMVQPKKLFIIADGARFPEEYEKCCQARSIINKVHWECEVLTNFSEINLGCKQRVSSGLSWVFTQVEEAIILEDDCLPSLSFFYFCQNLLERYQHDQRIMMISGNKFPSGEQENNYSYSFSKYTLIWGWATWKRAWQHYDVNMKTWQEFKTSNMMEWICEDYDERKSWISKFDRVFNGVIDTWDFQWTYTCWSQSGLCIIPKVNLVTNLGFGPEATHTKSEIRKPGWEKSDIWDIIHPPFIIRDRNADNYIFTTRFGGKEMKANQSIWAKIHRKLDKFINYLVIL